MTELETNVARVRYLVEETAGRCLVRKQQPCIVIAPHRVIAHTR